MKYCHKCKTEKPKTEFNKDKTTKDGLNCYCRECRKKTSKEAYYFYNPQEEKFCGMCNKRLGYGHKFLKYCPDCRKERDKEKQRKYEERQRQEQPERKRFYLRVWRKKNQDKVNEQNKRAALRKRGIEVAKPKSQKELEFLSLPLKDRRLIVIARTNEKLKKYWASQYKKG